MMAETSSKRVTKADLEARDAEIARLRSVIDAQEAEAACRDADDRQTAEALAQSASMLNAAANEIEAICNETEDERQLFGAIAAVMALEAEALHDRFLFAFNTLTTAAIFPGAPEGLQDLLSVVIDELRPLADNSESYEPDNFRLAALTAVVGEDLVAAAQQYDADLRYLAAEGLYEDACACQGACQGGQ